MAEVPVVNYSDVSGEPSKYIIFDVRGREEVINNGQIPGSHCIPVTEMSAALALNDADFKTLYGFEKPSKSDQIVTHCMKGGRALKAATELVGAGFSNTKCYSASFNNWVENGGSVIKPGKPYSSS